MLIVKTDDVVVRSVVSGKTYRAIATGMTGGESVLMLAIDVREGESGTGFVDEKESLHVLSSELDNRGRLSWLPNGSKITLLASAPSGHIGLKRPLPVVASK